ncbi:MAG: hypothetical protein L0Z68_09530 [Gammaproteobacteria bacterium]|nr:hypothetical protein [Gammaproteobacteria bacterium]
MNPNTRSSKIFALTNQAVSELKTTLKVAEGAPDIEFVLVLRSDGNVDFLAPPGDELVNFDLSRKKYTLHKVPKECQTGYEIQGVEVEEGSADVRKRTENKIGKVVNPIAFSVFENSGCACTGGGCVYR